MKKNDCQFDVGQALSLRRVPGPPVQESGLRGRRRLRACPTFVSEDEYGL
jgi:hypothetical protein